MVRAALEAGQARSLDAEDIVPGDVVSLAGRRG